MYHEHLQNIVIFANKDGQMLKRIGYTQVGVVVGDLLIFFGRSFNLPTSLVKPRPGRGHLSIGGQTMDLEKHDYITEDGFLRYEVSCVISSWLN